MFIILSHCILSSGCHVAGPIVGSYVSGVVTGGVVTLLVICISVGIAKVKKTKRSGSKEDK